MELHGRFRINGGQHPKPAPHQKPHVQSEEQRNNTSSRDKPLPVLVVRTAAVFAAGDR